MANISNKILSTITFSRFPLIYLIVLEHTIILNQSYPNNIKICNGDFFILDIIQFISQREIADLAVPTFFFISGFLFFNSKEMNYSTWMEKLKRRVYSLLIPYIIWNFLFLLYYALILFFFPSFIKKEWGYNFNNIVDWIDIFIGFSKGPFLSPLWFIRDLMFLNLLAYPLYNLFIKKTNKFIILFFVTLYIIGYTTKWYDIPFLGIRSFVPYTIGAWFAINKFSFIPQKKISDIMINVLFFSSLIIETFLYFKGNYLYIYVRQFEILLGIFFILLYFYKLKEIIKIKTNLAESSFFIFVTHMFIMNFPNKFWVLIFPINGLTASIMYFLIPLTVSFFLYYIFLELKKITPNLLKVLIGGRSN